MATFVYNNARKLFATKGIDWLTDPINAMLLSAVYSPSPTHRFVSEIPGGSILVRDVALTSLTAEAGICAGLIPEFDAFLSAVDVAAVLLYSKQTLDSASPLIYYSSDGVGFPFTPQGFNYAVVYQQTYGGFFQV